MEANLRREGCRDPLRVWEKENLLLDGHNRYAICEKWCIPYGVTYLDFENREAALLWIEENQLGRRNLTDEQRAMLIKSIERRRANTPEAKAARTEAATIAAAAKKNGTSVNSKMLLTDQKRIDVELSKKHKVPQRKLQDAGTVLAAAEKPNAPQAIKELPAKVKRGELTNAKARKIVKAQEPAKTTKKPPSNPHRDLLDLLHNLDTPRFLSTIKALPPTDAQRESLLKALKAASKVLQQITGAL